LYTIRFTDGALLELERLSVHHRNRILDVVAKHLVHEPTLTTRHKKVIEGLEAPWDQIGPIWQLRAGDYRGVLRCDSGSGREDRVGARRALEGNNEH
jgi:hypothetical protein